MNRALNWIGQAVLYSCFALAIGIFSRWPVYHPLQADHALIKVSFVHHGVRVADCRPYTKEELAKLAPNMRAPMKCERERSPVQIEMDIDGKMVFQKTAHHADNPDIFRKSGSARPQAANAAGNQIDFYAGL